MLTSRMDSRLTDYVTTRWYRAPEVCCRALSDACKYQGDSGMLAADVWSLACVVGEVLRDDNAPIFCGKSSAEQAALIGIALGPLDVEAIYYYDSYARDSEVYEAMIEGGSSLPGESDRCLISLPSLYKYGVPPLAVDLLRKMLTYDPSKRLTAAEVLRHPFFEGLKVEGGIAETLPSSNASTTTSRRETLSYPFHARRNVKDAIRDCNNNLFSSSSSSS